MNQDQIDELAAVMSLTSDRLVAAWQASAPTIKSFGQDLAAAMARGYRSLYYAGLVNTPLGNHPMTARKMRGAIRRLKVGTPHATTEDQ